MTARHDTVFLKEAVDALDIQPSDIVIDGTVGGAGHFAAIQELLSSDGILIGIDADPEALVRAEAVQKEHGPAVHLVEDNFRNLEAVLNRYEIGYVDKILLDLGWSGFQLESNRGFTFKKEEPLLMTYGTRERGNTAADLINTATEEELSHILFTYGEERFARNIARGIVEARKKERILSTQALVDVVTASTPEWYQHKRIHPATKTFQALRIAVNHELDAITDVIAAAFERLAPGGRIAFITFHSIEDRIVKNAFREAAQQGVGELITKKPIAPSAAELKKNPRSRSAKLRVFQMGDRVAPPSESFHALTYAG
jgi:16S rRNA (cytosine1402-N4)-methyltransferase